MANATNETPLGLPDDDTAKMAALLAREAAPSFRIAVKQTPTELHPIARKAECVLRSATPDTDWGCVRCTIAELPYVRVSPRGVERAVLLLDAMSRAFDARGWRWQPGTSGAWSTASVVVEGEPFRIHLEETSRRVRHKETPEERRQRRARQDSWEAALEALRGPPTEWDFHATNEFAIRHLTSTTLLRDTPTKSIEEKFNRLPVRMIEIAFERRAEQRTRALRERQAAERERRREELRQARALAAGAVERLETHAAQWRRAEQIRAFLSAAAARAIPDDVATARSEWLAWGAGRADALDPLVNLERIVAREADILAELRRLEAALAEGKQ
jgi:hypothetical protein